jgi:N6-adenosine-specific RNA methylase IME4
MLQQIAIRDLVIERLSRASEMLVEAKSMQEVKKIMDVAGAAKIYARRQQLGEEAVQHARSIELEAMRRLGELLAETPKNKGAQGHQLKAVPKENRLKDVTPTLADLGVDKKISSLSQQLARMPKKEFEQVRDGVVGIAEALRQVKVEKYKQKIESIGQIKSKEVGPFDLVLADPPWRYDHQEADNRKIENHYLTATIEEIESHCPNTSRDSILFLWATSPKLKEAMQVMEAWGFEYKTHAIWDKEIIGMGYWFRGQHELLLVGTKGSPGATPQDFRVSSVFREKRSKHSAKPVCVYEWIEKAFAHKSKLEMYCRSPRKNWAAWGNEI